MLNNDLGGYSFGETADGKPGYRKPGADSVTPFSSFPENLRFYANADSRVLSFKVEGKTTLTFSLNNRYGNGSSGYYPSYDYLDIYDGQPKSDNYTSNIVSGMTKIATLTQNGMTFIDASSYLALCKSGYITLIPHTASAASAICYVKDIVLK